MNREWYNFMRRAWNPAFACRSVASFVGKVGQRLAGWEDPVLRYPEAVRQAYLQCGAAPSGKPDWRASGAAVSPTLPIAALGPKRVKLATGYLDFDAAPDWGTRFDDFEMTVSLHRWNWLLIALSENGGHVDAEWGTALIRSWLCWAAGKRTGPAWESYSTGERIVSACLFYALVDGQDKPLQAPPDDIAAQLVEMAHFLAGQLEYHRPDATGNHVVNNARALLFAGQLLGRPMFSELAVAILHHNMPIVVTADGFLREGSSHYQLLFTRWVLEMLWLAGETAQHQAVDALMPYVCGLVRQSAFFMVRGGTADCIEFPLLGDISPDCTPSWLHGVSWSRLARLYCPAEALTPPSQLSGWASLWEDTSIERYDANNDALTQSWLDYPKSHWHRLDCHGITAFWRTQGGGKTPTHGHNDAGSFVLYYRGTPILVDCGRLSYKRNHPIGLYGLSGRSHNCLMLDGLDPSLGSGYSRLPDFYRISGVQTCSEEFPDAFVFTVENEGYHRLAGGAVTHVRRFTFGRASLVIEDTLTGSGNHRVETLFHWAPEIVLEKAAGPQTWRFRFGGETTRGVFCVETDELASARLSWQAYQGVKRPLVAGWCSPAYGALEETTTLLFSEMVRLPFVRRYVLNF